MFFIIITLITSLLIAGVAAWYSITGLAAIFAGAAIPIMIMGAVLEVGKLVTASWLYRNWNNTSLLLKSYLTTSVFILMFITSVGIFGFLSKAHLDHTIQGVGNSTIQITNLERQLRTQQKNIADAETVISQLDQTVQVLINYDRIRGDDGAIAVRKSQEEQREELNTDIQEAYEKIEKIENKLLPLRKERVSLEAEVGPLKYIAELIYGSEAESHFDEAVRWIIILIIFVFDPLAVLLLIAANQSIVERNVGKREETLLPIYDDGVEVINKENIYDDIDEDDDYFEEDKDIIFTESSDAEEYEGFEVLETFEEEPEVKNDGVYARVPYNAKKGLIEESRGR